MKKVFNFIFLCLLITIIFTSNKVYAEEKWIGECVYGYDGSMSTFLYFNRQTWDYTIMKNIYKIDFTREELLDYYDEHKKCPVLYVHSQKAWYENKTPTLDFNSDNSEYALDKLQETINNENDNWLTEDEEIYSQCYFELSGSSSGAYIPNGVININFNNKHFNVSMLDNSLTSTVSGLTLYDSQGGSQMYTLNGWDINLDDLHYYYENNSNGCPPRVYWDTDGKLYLPKNTENHKEKYTFDYSNDSTSKNKELNLDGSEITSSNTSLPNITTCTGLLGEPDDEGSPAFYLVKAFDVIKYVAIVLLIVLSVMDFTGAVTKQDKDALAKILKKVMMRFILCIIIFFLPYFVKLLLHYLVESQSDLCGIGGTVK